ncbi:DUF1906 domain-containing protein [Paraburkholderia caribensis]|uniref:DUF1906 domain-containing protein n=1 Tax=Paraburkholderia caribensis TaxID=75105 RepID=UPI0031D45444
MTAIIDVSRPCGNQASALATAGVKTVIRYYSRDTIHPSKRLTRAEAEQLHSAGLRLGVVHEGRFGDTASNFDRQSGTEDGLYARRYGATEIGQPGGTAIYFGVDFDASSEQIRTLVVPYFQGVADAFASHADQPNYLVGVYGSGATCDAVLNAGLAHFAWLAQSTGWAGHQSFFNSRRWTLNQAMPASIVGVPCDPDTAGDGMIIGDFILPSDQLVNTSSAAEGTSTSAAMQMYVNARGGLHLRSGPGVEFNITRLLPLGAPVYPLKSTGSWTAVDLQGDGIADGFVSSAFLTAAPPPAQASARSSMTAQAANLSLANVLGVQETSAPVAQPDGPNGHISQ